MLDKRSSLCGIVILVSLFFVPNSAFATVAGPLDVIMPILLLIAIVVFPPAFVYLGIISLKHFKPSLGNYISSNRLIKIGLYFLAVGSGWAFYRVLLTILTGTSISFGVMWTDFMILLIIPAILLFSIAGIKDQLSKTSRHTKTS